MVGVQIAIVVVQLATEIGILITVAKLHIIQWRGMLSEIKIADPAVMIETSGVIEVNGTNELIAWTETIEPRTETTIKMRMSASQIYEAPIIG